MSGRAALYTALFQLLPLIVEMDAGLFWDPVVNRYPQSTSPLADSLRGTPTLSKERTRRSIKEGKEQSTNPSLSVFWEGIQGIRSTYLSIRSKQEENVRKTRSSVETESAALLCQEIENFSDMLQGQKRRKVARTDEDVNAEPFATPVEYLRLARESAFDFNEYLDRVDIICPHSMRSYPHQQGQAARSNAIHIAKEMASLRTSLIPSWSSVSIYTICTWT